MNREGKILTALLDVMAEWSTPLDTVVINRLVDSKLTGRGEPEMRPAEHQHALRTALNEGWLAEVPSKRRGTLFSITDKGEAERLK